MFDAMLNALERELQAALTTAVAGLVATAQTRLEAAVAEVAEERAKGLAEVDARRAELHREIAAMQTHQETQEGCVELNIGGYCFETSVPTLRRVPHTFFDAYFSGRYAQDVCRDGSIFVDRDGQHFSHVLEYMRDGVLAVAQPGALPSVSLLRALKREFGFYCMELCVVSKIDVEMVGAVVPEVAYVMGGYGNGHRLSSVERYDSLSGQWSTVADILNERSHFGSCVLNGNIYVTGGTETGADSMTSVEKYCPSTDTWSTVAPLLLGSHSHAAVVIGSAMYVFGGTDSDGQTFRNVFVFDSPEGSWSEMEPMPDERCDAAACVVGSDVYIFGGGAGVHDTDAVLKFDTEANEWSILADMPLTCFNCHGLYFRSWHDREAGAPLQPSDRRVPFPSSNVER
jgi:hypothetical protein